MIQNTTCLIISSLLVSELNKFCQLISGDNLKPLKAYLTLSLIIISVIVLAYVSYLTGYEKSEKEMDSLLMTMNIDSNIVVTGLYEELPNNLRKTMHFYIEDTPTIVKNVVIVAQVKYITVGGEEINVDSGEIWKLIKKDKIFQRQFNSDKEEKKETVPSSPFASLLDK